MSALLMAAVLAAAPLETTTVGAASETPAMRADEPAVPFRTGRELRQAARERLRRWARPADHELEPAADELLAILRELEADTELAVSLREPLIRQVRGRLADLARRRQPRTPAKDHPAAGQRAERVGADHHPRPMAQFGGGFPGAGFQGGGFQGGMGMQRGMAGQPMMGMGRQDQPRHSGQELLELIQTTIRPNSWDRVGGPGTIYFWR